MNQYDYIILYLFDTYELCSHKWVYVIQNLIICMKIGYQWISKLSKIG